ncbi:hypothetical protein FJTKL_07252 [Diaporthe vaccinii]|uniref:Uncharacterized protein n=1 Tax=Diaporthe vaccinii TaxID=105482 RepID=A0ABR4EU93_9PEZI
MRVQRLSLNLKECTSTDCFRNSGLEDGAVGGLNDGYDDFYERVEARIRKDLLVEAEFRKFLPEVKEFYFESSDIPYQHSAFFALRSLRRIFSMRDTGAWSMILDSDYDIGTRNPHIKELWLRNSAIVPLDLYVISRSFPGLDKFGAWTNPEEANRQYDTSAVTVTRLDRRNSSVALPRWWRYLRVLKLGLHYFKAPGGAQINFPLHLGPTGGITSLGWLDNLTELTIGMHHVMCHKGENSEPRARPLLPTVLPPNLENLRLYTCLKCWDNWIAVLSRYPEDQTLPSHAGDSTLIFVESLVTHVSSGAGLGGLRDVRIYSQIPWWLAYGSDYRTVKHCEEEQGQVWNAGGFEDRCMISLLENRTPGVHFRAYESDEYGCG